MKFDPTRASILYRPQEPQQVSYGPEWSVPQMPELTELEVREDPLLVFAFWHMCLATGLIVGLLLGVLLGPVR